MTTILRIEELSLALLSIYLFRELNFAWWWYPALILVPDVSMLGYLAGPKVGAWIYNIAHHKGVAVTLLILGAYAESQSLTLAGTILLGHASLDRVFGYGLKYTDSFRHTHLGMIGSSNR